jgi:hypothetical protein
MMLKKDNYYCTSSDPASHLTSVHIANSSELKQQSSPNAALFISKRIQSYNHHLPMQTANERLSFANLDSIKLSHHDIALFECWLLYSHAHALTIHDSHKQEATILKTKISPNRLIHS